MTDLLFEKGYWKCKNCFHTNVELCVKYDENIKVICKKCGEKSKEKPHPNSEVGWDFDKCFICKQVESCKDKIEKKRLLMASRIGFCEDYEPDLSKFSINRFQVCEEEREEWPLDDITEEKEL